MAGSTFFYVLIFIAIVLIIIVIAYAAITFVPGTEAQSNIQIPIFKMYKSTNGLTYSVNEGITPILNWELGKDGYNIGGYAGLSTGSFQVPKKASYLFQYELVYTRLTAGAVGAPATSREIGIGLFDYFQNKFTLLDDSNVILYRGTNALASPIIDTKVNKRTVVELEEGHNIVISFYQIFDKTPTSVPTASITFSNQETANFFSGDQLLITV